MRDLDTGSESLLNLLKVLAELQFWEVSNSTLLQSVAGRQLYFGLIRHIAFQGDAGLTVDSMKKIYYDKGINLTERGVRLTIRSFEAAGILVLGRAVNDGRSKRIFLTQKFQKQMQDHALIFKEVLEKNYLLIEKNS